jgi:hypothetical protein
MDIGRITLALAFAAVSGPVTSELHAQEFDLPPAPSSATESGGTAFSAENGPCFYNPYGWMARSALNQTLIAAEMQDLAGGGTSWGSGCLGHYAVTAGDLYGPWSYMLNDGVPRPEHVSQEKVKAVWEASRKAEAEARMGHVWVPTIGNGHGSDKALASQTLVLGVAPRPTPPTYNGVPIIERGRAWERFEATDGSRVWREVPQSSPYGSRAGLRTGDGGRAYSTPGRADKRIQFEEGIRLAPRSMPQAPRFFPRVPAASSGSSRSGSAAPSSPSSSSSSPRLESPRRGSKKEQ